MLYVLIWNCIFAFIYFCSFCAYMSFFGFLCMYGIFDTDKKQRYEEWITKKENQDSGHIQLDEDFTAKFMGRIKQTTVTGNLGSNSVISTDPNSISRLDIKIQYGLIVVQDINFPDMYVYKEVDKKEQERLVYSKEECGCCMIPFDK